MADKTLSVRLAMVDGNFNKQIQTITKETKLLESEFKAIEAGSKDFGKTLDGQKAKLKLLEGTYSNAKKKVEVYNKAVESQKKTIEKAEKAVDDKKKSLIDMNKKLSELESTYGKNSKEVKEFKDKIKDAEKSLKQKENALVSASDKMTKYKTDMNGAIGECNKLEREIRETSEAISNMEKDIKITVDMNKDGADGVNELGTSIDNTVDKSAKLSIIAQGLTDVGDRAKEAGKDILEGLGGLADAGGEYEIALNKIKIQLGANEQAVRSWAAENSKSLGLTDLQLVSLVGNNNMLASKMGLTGNAAIEQAKKMAILVQDLSTFEDIDLVDAQEKFKSALNGSTEIMDQYGVDISKATLEQNSYFKSLKKSWNSLTETEKKMIRLDQITKDLAHTQGNAKSESDSYNVQLALLKANTAEIAATLGQQLIPLLQPIIEKVGQVATAFANWVKENPKLAQILLIIAGAVGVILTVLGSILVPIGLCITAFMGLSAATATLGISVGALLSPILLVIGAILAIVAVVAVLVVKWDEIKQCWDNFINWSSKKWEDFKVSFIKKWTEIKENAIQFGKDLANAVKDSWNSFITWATTKWDNFSTWFLKKWEEIKTYTINKAKECVDWIVNKWTGFIDWLGSWADRLANLVNSTWQNVKDTACRWANNLVSGITSVFSTLFDVITSPFRRAWSFISGIGEKIGGLISKINPFNWFSLDTGLEVPVNYNSTGLDNVALSGSYYNANTRASNNLSDFIKLSNNIPTKNNIGSGNNNDINTRLLGNQISNAIIQALSGIKLNAEINTEINGRQVAGAVTNTVIKNVDSQIKSRNWR